MPIKPTLVPLILIALLSTACRPGGETSGEASPDSGDSTTPGEEFTMPVPASGVPGETIQAAAADLGSHLGLEPAEVEVLDAKSVTWPNGALGCPEPGGMYTQALVDGYVIRLNAGGRIYHYHGRKGGDPFRCPPERRGKPSNTSSAN